MTIYKVTKEYIEQGIENSANYSPISICMKEQNGEYLQRSAVRTFSDSIYSMILLNEYARKNHIYEYRLSDDLQQWIKDFNTSKPVPEIAICVEKDLCYIQEKNDDTN